MFIRMLLLMLSVLLTLACSNNAYVDSNSTLTFNIHYVDENNLVVQREDMPKEVVVLFPVIPGALAGGVLTQSKYQSFVRIGESFEINLNELSANVKQYATPKLSTSFTQNIQVSPEQTKMLRVGTFAYDRASAQFIGPTGIGSTDPNVIQLLLVYFDRPASFVGSLMEGNAKVDYQVNINNAGFSLLKVEKISSNSILVSVHKYQGDEFITIQAPNLSSDKDRT